MIVLVSDTSILIDGHHKIESAARGDFEYSGASDSMSGSSCVSDVGAGV